MITFDTLDKIFYAQKSYYWYLVSMKASCIDQVALETLSYLSELAIRRRKLSALGGYASSPRKAVRYRHGDLVEKV